MSTTAKGRRIVTYTRLRIDRMVDGNPQAEVWVRTLGGHVGDIGQHVDGEAVLMPSRPGLVLPAGPARRHPRGRGHVTGPLPARGRARRRSVPTAEPRWASVTWSRSSSASQATDRPPARTELVGRTLDDVADARGRRAARACALGHALAALAGLVIGLAYSAQALAYCRTTTCDKCMPAPGECPTEGIPLFWPVTCINYSVQKDASQRVGFDDVTAAADAAFQSWGNVTCPSGLAPTLEFANLGPVECNKHEYNDQSKSFGGNANIIIFRDEGFDQTAMDQTARHHHRDLQRQHRRDLRR